MPTLIFAIVLVGSAFVAGLIFALLYPMGGPR